jgi:hypothetical protein
MVFIVTFNNISDIVAVSFIGGGSQRTRRKPLTCRKSLTNFYHIMLYRVHLTTSGARTRNVRGEFSDSLNMSY